MVVLTKNEKCFIISTSKATRTQAGKARCKSATTAIAVKVGMPVGRDLDKIPWVNEGISKADGYGHIIAFRLCGLF